MERLTQMVHPGWGYCWTKLAFSDVAIMEDMIIDRLGAYEDTGLTPEEIEQLKDELKHAYEKSNTAVKWYYELKQSYEQLQKENAELKELLKLAFEDIRGIVIGMEECELCKNNDVGENIKYCHKHDFDCKNCEVLKDCKCGQCKGTNNWQWQHADKLKELGVKV